MHRCFLIVVLGLSAAAHSAVADVLVIRGSDPIETRGPWKVQGRQVVYTDVNGTLRSLRLDDVDLEASEEATRKAKAPPPAAEAPAASGRGADPPPAVMKVTNESLRRGPSRGAAGSDAEVLAEIREEFGKLGSGFGQGLGEAFSGMARGFAEGLGGEGATVEGGEELEALGQQMAEGMGKGMEAMGEVIGVLLLAVEQLQELQAQHDFETPEGIRAAAPAMDKLAGFIESQIANVGPEAAGMLNEFAGQIREVATLARTDPEAAIERQRRLNESNVNM